MKMFFLTSFAQYRLRLRDKVFTEAATRGVLFKKAFLEISQNSQENTCSRVSFLMKFKKLYEKRDSGTGVFL